MKAVEQLHKLVDELLAEPFDLDVERKAPGGRARIELRAALICVKQALKHPPDPKEKR